MTTLPQHDRVYEQDLLLLTKFGTNLTQKKHLGELTRLFGGNTPASFMYFDQCVHEIHRTLVRTFTASDLVLFSLGKQGPITDNILAAWKTVCPEEVSWIDSHALAVRVVKEHNYDTFTVCYYIYAFVFAKDATFWQLKYGSQL